MLSSHEGYRYMCDRGKDWGASNMRAKEQDEISVVVEEKLQHLFRILNAIKYSEDKRHRLSRTPQDMKDAETFSYFSQDPWEYFGFHGARTAEATTKDEGGKKPSEDDELLLQHSSQIRKDMKEEDSGDFTQNPNEHIGQHGPRGPPKEEERKRRKKKPVHQK